MRVRWFGQSAFHLEAGGQSVFIDPFGPMESAAARGLRFDYPPISGVSADLCLVTHEHADHSYVAAVGGSPRVIRSTAGSFETDLGPVTAVASEHDAAAGTLRGPNAVFIFELGGLRVCHFGDFGQRELRPEQERAIGRPELLFLPVGGGPTIDGSFAAELARRLQARWVVPMHYRTEATNFLEPCDAFLSRFEAGSAVRLETADFETGELPAGPCAVVPAVPRAA